MQLARKAICNPQLFSEIAEGLKAEKPRVKYGCAKALRLISEQRPDLLYPHFDLFVRLLDHKNKILQVGRRVCAVASGARGRR